MKKTSRKTVKLALAKETLKAINGTVLDGVRAAGLPPYATVSRCPYGC